MDLSFSLLSALWQVLKCGGWSKSVHTSEELAGAAVSTSWVDRGWAEVPGVRPAPRTGPVEFLLSSQGGLRLQHEAGTWLVPPEEYRNHAESAWGLLQGRRAPPPQHLLLQRPGTLCPPHLLKISENPEWRVTLLRKRAAMFPTSFPQIEDYQLGWRPCHASVPSSPLPGGSGRLRFGEGRKGCVMALGRGKCPGAGQELIRSGAGLACSQTSTPGL